MHGALMKVGACICMHAWNTQENRRGLLACMAHSGDQEGTACMQRGGRLTAVTVRTKENRRGQLSEWRHVEAGPGSWRARHASHEPAEAHACIDTLSGAEGKQHACMAHSWRTGGGCTHAWRTRETRRGLHACIATMSCVRADSMHAWRSHEGRRQHACMAHS